MVTFLPVDGGDVLLHGGCRTEGHPGACLGAGGCSTAAGRRVCPLQPPSYDGEPAGGFSAVGLVLDPSDIPPWMELELPEPAVAGGNDEQVQRLLSYPIAISVNVTGDNPSSDAPRLHPPPADSDRRRRRRWVRRTSSPTPAADASNFPAGGRRASVHSRLGPLAGDGCSNTRGVVSSSAVGFECSVFHATPRGFHEDALTAAITPVAQVPATCMVTEEPLAAAVTPAAPVSAACGIDDNPLVATPAAQVPAACGIDEDPLVATPAALVPASRSIDEDPLVDAPVSPAPASREIDEEPSVVAFTPVAPASAPRASTPEEPAGCRLQRCPSPMPVGDDAVASAPLTGAPVPASRSIDEDPLPVVTTPLLAETTPLPGGTRAPPAMIMTTPVNQLVASELSHRILPDNLIVYTRKPRKREEGSPKMTEFLNKIVKPVEAIVPAPTIQKRRKKTAGPVSLPRRSRRIANLPPETDRFSASTVCRKLGLTDDEGRISEEALERYSKFYNHLLGRDHVTALSALFGWDVPPEGQARIAANSTIVI